MSIRISTLALMPWLLAAALAVLAPPSPAQPVEGSDYKKLEAQKPAIKAANISTFLLITLAILFAAIWTGSTLSRRITGPIAALAESMRKWRGPLRTTRVSPSSRARAPALKAFHQAAGQRLWPIVFQTVAVGEGLSWMVKISQ